jgi:cytochrome c551/c552
MDVVEAQPSHVALSICTKRMYYSPAQAKAASEMLCIGCHQEDAAQLTPALKQILQQAA